MEGIDARLSTIIELGAVRLKDIQSLLNTYYDNVDVVINKKNKTEKELLKEIEELATNLDKESDEIVERDNIRIDGLKNELEKEYKSSFSEK